METLVSPSTSQSQSQDQRNSSSTPTKILLKRKHNLRTTPTKPLTSHNSNHSKMLIIQPTIFCSSSNSNSNNNNHHLHHPHHSINISPSRIIDSLPQLDISLSMTTNNMPYTNSTNSNNTINSVIHSSQQRNNNLRKISETTSTGIPTTPNNTIATPIAGVAQKSLMQKHKRAQSEFEKDTNSSSLKSSTISTIDSSEQNLPTKQASLKAGYGTYLNEFSHPISFVRPMSILTNSNTTPLAVRQAYSPRVYKQSLQLQQQQTLQQLQASQSPHQQSQGFAWAQSTPNTPQAIVAEIIKLNESVSTLSQLHLDRDSILTSKDTNSLQMQKHSYIRGTPNSSSKQGTTTANTTTASTSQSRSSKATTKPAKDNSQPVQLPPQSSPGQIISNSLQLCFLRGRAFELKSQADRDSSEQFNRRYESSNDDSTPLKSVTASAAIAKIQKQQNRNKRRIIHASNASSLEDIENMIHFQPKTAAGGYMRHSTNNSNSIEHEFNSIDHYNMIQSQQKGRTSTTGIDSPRKMSRINEIRASVNKHRNTKSSIEADSHTIATTTTTTSTHQGILIDSQNNNNNNNNNNQIPDSENCIVRFFKNFHHHRPTKNTNHSKESASSAERSHTTSYLSTATQSTPMSSCLYNVSPSRTPQQFRSWGDDAHSSKVERTLLGIIEPSDFSLKL